MNKQEYITDYWKSQSLLTETLRIDFLPPLIHFIMLPQTNGTPTKTNINTVHTNANTI